MAKSVNPLLTTNIHNAYGLVNSLQECINVHTKLDPRQNVVVGLFV